MFGDLPVFDDVATFDDAQRELAARELGDGLPLVPPTRRRLEAMLRGVNAPDVAAGAMPPLFGEVTPAAVAYNCVLAGCEPQEFKLVFAAATACLAPEFNLLGVETTTGTPAVAMLVHGPIAKELGINSGTNCFGPGTRANASIGRALRLTLLNIGGARAGVADMATMGQPGKYTFCFAENDENLFQPFHVRRGFDARDSAVTILAVSGTAELLPKGEGATPEEVLWPVAVAMAAAAHQTRSLTPGRKREQIFCLPPELARLIITRGWGLAQMCAFLDQEGRAASQRLDASSAAADHAVAESPASIFPVVVGGAGLKMSYLPLWSGGSRLVTVRVA
jgi:hypothetical protein